MPKKIKKSVLSLRKYTVDPTNSELVYVKPVNRKGLVNLNNFSLNRRYKSNKIKSIGIPLVEADGVVISSETINKILRIIS